MRLMLITCWMLVSSHLFSEVREIDSISEILSEVILNPAENSTFDKASAPGLQQAKPVSKQPMCEHMGDADSCKDGDDGAVKSGVFSRVQYNAESVVLFDIDETLIESPVMLGGKAWRRYVRDTLKTQKSAEEVGKIHDKITYLIAQRIPYTAIEEGAHACWRALHEAQVPVFGFTARGKRHWYDMPADGEELAIQHLGQAGFDLSLWHAHQVDDALLLHPSYARRIFFAYPADKGDLVLSLFSQARFVKAVFVDDKLENAQSVDRAFKQLGISAVCFYYRHVDLYQPFDPMVANIQLEKLFFEGTRLSNEEALLLKGQYVDKHPDEFLLELIARLEL